MTGSKQDLHPADERAEIWANRRTFCLLANYVILELVLTRSEEREKLITAAHGLRFRDTNYRRSCQFPEVVA